jgi:hypothetical protein
MYSTAQTLQKVVTVSCPCDDFHLLSPGITLALLAPSLQSSILNSFGHFCVTRNSRAHLYADALLLQLVCCLHTFRPSPQTCLPLPPPPGTIPLAHTDVLSHSPPTLVKHTSMLMPSLLQVCCCPHITLGMTCFSRLMTGYDLFLEVNLPWVCPGFLEVNLPWACPGFLKVNLPWV